MRRILVLVSILLCACETGDDYLGEGNKVYLKCNTVFNDHTYTKPVMVEYQVGQEVTPLDDNEGKIESIESPLIQPLCFDNSTGVLRLIPCPTKSVFYKGSSPQGHDDPEPWYPNGSL